MSFLDRIPRRRAVLTHAGATMLLALAGIALIGIAWYPGGLFVLAGGARLAALFVAAIVVTGPLLTLLLFKPGKRGLVIDVVTTAVLQVGAAIVALALAANARPLFVVFAVDRFVVVPANALSDDDLAGAPASLVPRAFGRPRYVAAVMPEDAEARNEILMSALAGRDLELMPGHYAPYRAHVADVLARRRPLATLAPKDPARVAAFVARHGSAATQLGYVPAIVRGRASVLVLDALGTPVDWLDVDPW